MGDAPSQSSGAEQHPVHPIDEEDEEVVPAPWHFKVLVIGTVGYLIYRFIWIIFWATGHPWHG